MEFLPTIVNGKRVYAGLWVRFGAAVVDIVVIVPIVFGLLYLQPLNFALTLFLAAFSTVLFAFYNVYFNAAYGGTLGKLAMGIRVTMPNGLKIGWREAWYRSSVDLVFAVLLLVLELLSLLSVDWQAYQAAEFGDRINLVSSQYPNWQNAVDAGNNIWFWSELIVLLLNERRRAIHDYIAGTVVIQKEFAK